MRKSSYTYCLVKYIHDPAAGEMLNVGVLMCAPSESFVDGKFDHHYERLSNTFADFNGDHYRDLIRNLESAVHKLKARDVSPTLFVVNSRFETVEQMASYIVPDRGLSIQFGQMLAGLTDDLENELTHIFQEAVISQYPHKEKTRRDDEDVWALYRKPLSQKHVDRFLEPVRLISDSYDYKFDHAFKNEKWHVLKPVNMDYAQSHTIQDRATKLFGEASALVDSPELSRYYVLLGEPRIKSHKAAYVKAKNLLHKIPIEKQIIEENEARDFADYLADYMEKHGVIKDLPQ